MANFIIEKVEIDENRELVDGIIDDVWPGMKFGKQNPLSSLDVFCGAMILSGLPTPSEQG